MRRASFVAFVLVVACHGREATRAPTAAPKATTPQTDNARTRLAIVVTGNLRGAYAGTRGAGGLARAASALDATRAAFAGTVFIDAGDVFPSDGPPQAIDDVGELSLTSMHRMGVAAIVPGESDLAVGPKRLKQVGWRASAPFVASNLRARDGQPVFTDAVVVAAAGLFIGVFGVVDPSPATRAAWVDAGFTLDDPIATARAQVAALRARGARVVIAGAHLAQGIAGVKALVAAVPSIDIVLVTEGRDTPATASPFVLGSTRVVVAASPAAKLQRITLPLDAWRSGATTNAPVETDSVPLDASITEQNGVALLARLFENERDHVELPAVQNPKAYESWTYGSNGACELCHQAAVAQWKTTAHAGALRTLVDRDRGRDPACLGCHTTGFLHAGGTRVLETATTYFADVGCESCHGPSVVHVRAATNKKHTGTSRGVPEAVCRGCHTPDESSTPFNYEAMLATVVGPGHGQKKN